MKPVKTILCTMTDGWSCDRSTVNCIYHQFDGKIYEYSSNVSNNPYLTVQANGSNLQINTVPQ